MRFILFLFVGVCGTGKYKTFASMVEGTHGGRYTQSSLWGYYCDFMNIIRNFSWPSVEHSKLLERYTSKIYPIIVMILFSVSELWITSYNGQIQSSLLSYKEMKVTIWDLTGFPFDRQSASLHYGMFLWWYGIAYYYFVLTVYFLS